MHHHRREEFITKRWKHWQWRFIKTPHIHHSVSTLETTQLHPSSSFLSTFWIFPSYSKTFQQSADAVVKWYCSKLFAENNTSHFRWMVVRVCPVVHDFLSLSAGSGVSSPGFRGLSIWVCSTAQGNCWRGQTEGSAGNNNTGQIMTQYNTVVWKWLSYHQGYHMLENVVTYEKQVLPLVREHSGSGHF